MVPSSLGDLVKGAAQHALPSPRAMGSAGGCIIGTALWVFTVSLSYALVAFGTFLGGGLSIIGVVWWDSYRTMDSEAAILDSIRRSFERQLQVTRPPSILADIANGRSPSLTLDTPIDFVADLRPAIEIAARHSNMESLYTSLMLVDQTMTHLRYLNWMLPLLRTSPWGVAGVDIVSFEGRRAPRSEEEALARWRQHRILIFGEIESGRTQVALLAHIRAALPEIQRILTSRYPRYQSTPNPELSIGHDDPRFNRLAELVNQPPGSADSMVPWFSEIQEEMKRVLAEWDRSPTD